MNTDQADELVNQVKQSAEKLAQQGEDIRAGVSRLVADAAVRLSQTKDGLTALVRAVSEGAVAGAARALPDQSESVLRSVVDGLADGLERSANAVRLTLAESSASGVHFAKEDLNQILTDFRAVGSSFTAVVSGAMAKLSGHASGQLHSLVEHAKQTFQNARPSVEAAVTAALQDPVKLGRESVQAGASAARQAAGVLFSELGARLQGGGGKPGA
jgi:hypothetical protein